MSNRTRHFRKDAGWKLGAFFEIFLSKKTKFLENVTKDFDCIYLKVYTIFLCNFRYLRISSIAARRQAHWTKVYAGGLFSVRWNDFLLHTISAKWRSGKWCFGKAGKRRSAERRFGKVTFGWTTIRKNVVRHYEVSLIRRFFPKDFRKFFFRKTTIRLNCNSAKRRFDGMTVRENDVAPTWGAPRLAEQLQ